jgi:hypothetical protein
LAAELATAEHRQDHLEDVFKTTIDRLPKTADHAPIVPGDNVYDPVDGLMHQVWDFWRHSDRWLASANVRTLRLDECYSSREAYLTAEAAKEKPRDVVEDVCCDVSVDDLIGGNS